ncbi:MAG: dihydroorotase [Chloroflexota bacterium]|nr:dihydroorotase [Chloroflexota bacterium]
MIDGTVLLRGGHVIDPANGVDGQYDILVRNGIIDQIGSVESAPDVPEFDAAGCLVAPGWIDVHVHLREPGFPEKETMETGTAAAAAGGFTAIACMPNTKPALDSPEIIADVLKRAADAGQVRVFPIATITRGRSGDEPVDFEAVIEAGAIGWSDDGDTTANSAIMRQALEASVRLDRPVIVHCEDKALAQGAMHEGEVSRRLGIQGIPAVAEEIIIGRDLMLAELTGGWLHVCHVSTGRGAELIAEARRRGVNVTAEVMPHHLVMSDEWVSGSRTLHNTHRPAGNPAMPADPNTKVNPPLRTVADTKALIERIQDGTFDCFGTDHAPHAEPEKAGSAFDAAAMGLSGLEFAFPLTLALVEAGHLSLYDLIRLWTVEPARILREERGTLTPGAPADITVFDPDREWVVTPGELRTMSANTPLLGMTMKGRAVLTLVDGKERHRA